MDSLGCHFDWNRVSTMSTFNTVRDIQSLRKSALAHLITINGRSGFFLQLYKHGLAYKKMASL